MLNLELQEFIYNTPDRLSLINPELFTTLPRMWLKAT